MSFSGRPPIVPGMMHVPPPLLPPPNMLPSAIPSLMSQPPPAATYRAGPTINQHPQMYNKVELEPQGEEAVRSNGPVITVFIGNISERAPEKMIKRIFSTVGRVLNWKRVSTFGFCEYDGPTAGLRAVRLLHDLDVAGKKLVAKVDAKNKLLLDNYREEEVQTNEDDEKREDESALAAIERIISDHHEEIENFESLQEEQQIAKSNKLLKGVSIEDDKRDLINREIGKFRKTAEADEQKKEKEKDRKKREEKDTDKEKSRSSSSPRKEKEKKSSRRRSRSRNRDREREREKERERESERERREREREKEREREREKARENLREQRERERARDREREVKLPRDLQREQDMEDEIRERKKAEKKAHEKEAAYQERLRNWEVRERRRNKEYEKEKERELNREEEREKEAKRLKEFLEDYDDERDDPKYYRGRELQRRLTERLREADLDAKDRNKEHEELEELKNKIFSGEYDNPTQEFERLKKQREDLYKPKILIDVNLEQSKQRERELERERERDAERQKVKERERAHKERYVIAQASRELAAVNAEPIDSTDSSNDGAHFEDSYNNDNGHGHGHNERHRSNSRHGNHTSDRVSRGSESRDTHLSNNYSQNDDDHRSSIHSERSFNSPPLGQGDRRPGTPSMTAPVISLNLSANAKKKRLEVKDIFNNDDDAEDVNGSKRRKLVPLDYEDQKSSSKSSTTGQVASESSAPAPVSNSNSSSRKKEDSHKKDEAVRSQEEKRRHIKSIIDKIPTAKSDLFNYKLDWNEIDNGLIEKKIRPWINKKIIEYIGEPEPTLVDFICSKVLAGSTPQGILDDVQMVLDEEAEVFVVKMWRLLIYEVEAKAASSSNTASQRPAK